MRLRQVALAARALAPAVKELTEVLGVEVCYNDPGVAKFGLENALMPIGDAFVEVVAPMHEGTSAGRLLDKRKGDGGYMVILQVDDIAAARARIAAAGVRIIEEAEGKRFAMSHLHPKDIGGAIVSVDQMTPKDHWEWAGPSWRDHVRDEISVALTGVEVQGGDPGGMARRWAEALGRTVELRGDAFVIPLDASTLRFVVDRDGRGDGVSAFDVSVKDVNEVRRRAQALGCIDADGAVTLCGTRVRLSQAA